MLTAEVSSFYSQHKRAESTSPRQLRMARPFVILAKRHVGAFSLPTSHISGKAYINRHEPFHYHSSNLIVHYDTSVRHDGNQTTILRWLLPSSAPVMLQI